MEKINVIDYGMGNLKSIYNAFKHVGAEPVVVNTPAKIDASKKIVVPGVGAFGKGMKNLRLFTPKIKEAVNSDTPLLGICLGMQAFFEGSEESPRVKGMGIMEGRVVKIPTKLKLPSIGWNRLEIKKRTCPLFEGVDDGHVYFVHSYHVSPEENVVAATTEYGGEITASIWRDDIFGVQFHPEKSGAVGLKILKNFLEL